MEADYNVADIEAMLQDEEEARAWQDADEAEHMDEELAGAIAVDAAAVTPGSSPGPAVPAPAPAAVAKTGAQSAAAPKLVTARAGPSRSAATRSSLLASREHRETDVSEAALQYARMVSSVVAHRKRLNAMASAASAMAKGGRLTVDGSAPSSLTPSWPADPHQEADARSGSTGHDGNAYLLERPPAIGSGLDCVEVVLDDGEMYYLAMADDESGAWSSGVGGAADGPLTSARAWHQRREAMVRHVFAGRLPRPPRRGGLHATTGAGAGTAGAVSLLPVPISELRRQNAEARLRSLELRMAQSASVTAAAQAACRDAEAALAAAEVGGLGDSTMLAGLADQTLLSGGEASGVQAIARGMGTIAPVDDDDDDGGADRDGHGDGPAARPATTGAGAGTSALWVDRYAPRCFADLLSAEIVNRNVLKWVKLWDARVFGKAKASSAGAAAISGPPRITGVFGGGGVAAKRARTDGRSDAGASSAGSSSSSSAAAAPADRTGRSDGAGGFGHGWKPDAKVLLLCGPPGMGKTTLAHIVARTAGYRPVEVNASDDRSGKSIRDRIVDAQGTQAMFGSRKPALLILDEIDGIDGGSAGGIGELVRMIKVTPSLQPLQTSDGTGTGEGGWRAALAGKRGRGGGDGDGGGGGGDGDDGDGADDLAEEAAPAAGAGAGKPLRGGKTKGARRAGSRRAEAREAGGDGEEAGDAAASATAPPLTRPLICICNDQYAPALRDLRPLAQIVEFGVTSTERLLSRLRAICRAERLVVTPDALSTLARVTDNDVRACLNTLQFVKVQSERGRSAAAAAARRSRNSGLATMDNEGEGEGEGIGGGVAARDGLLRHVRVTSDVISKAAVGVKDHTRALYDVWSALFTKPDVRSGVLMKSRAAMDAVANAAASAGASFHGTGAAGGTHMAAASAAATAVRAAYTAELWQMMAAYSSETRQLHAGLFENLHSARVSDPTMARTLTALEWLCYGEELAARASGGGGGGGALLKYAPLAGLGVHSQMASDLRVKLAWPRTDSYYRAMGEAKRNLVASYLHGRASFLASAGEAASLGLGSLHVTTAVMDVLGPLVSIVSPPLRAVALTLLNTREKREANELVEALVYSGLTYAPKASAGNVGGRERRWQDREQADAAYTLSPEIHTLLEFGGESVWGSEARSSLPEVLRPLIAHEVRRARIRIQHRAREAAVAALGGGSRVFEADTGPKLAAHVLAALAGKGGLHSRRAVAPEHGPAPAASSTVSPAAAAAETSDREGGGSGGDGGSGDMSMISKQATAASGFLAIAAERARKAATARRRQAMQAQSVAATAAADAAAAASAKSSPSAGAHTAAAPRRSGAATSSAPGMVYRYQEGFTTAVKRPVRMSDFF